MKCEELLNSITKYYCDTLAIEKTRAMYPSFITLKSLCIIDRLNICDILKEAEYNIERIGEDFFTSLSEQLEISDMPVDLELLEYFLLLFNCNYDKMLCLFNISERQCMTFAKCLNNIPCQDIKESVHELKEFIYNNGANIDMPISAVEKEFINIMVKGIQGRFNVGLYVTRNLREVLFQLIEEDNKSNICRKIDCSVEELDNFIKGYDISLQGEKLELLCQILSLNKNRFLKWYFKGGNEIC